MNGFGWIRYQILMMNWLWIYSHYKNIHFTDRRVHVRQWLPGFLIWQSILRPSGLSKRTSTSRNPFAVVIEIFSWEIEWIFGQRYLLFSITKRVSIFFMTYRRWLPQFERRFNGFFIHGWDELSIWFSEHCYFGKYKNRFFGFKL